MHELRCPKKDLLMSRLIEAYRRLSDTEIFAEFSDHRMRAEAEMNAAHLEAGRHSEECVICRMLAMRRTVTPLPVREVGWQGKVAS
jgi:hypothetical protein